MSNFAIAVDGPAGSGKSTVSKIVAKNLGIIYIDTGAMYRAIGLYCIENGINTTDEEAVEKVIDVIKLTIKPEEGVQYIFIDDKNVTELIRTQEVGRAASDVASMKKVRSKLVAIQRELAKGNNVIMDGRDIGSNVLPDAELKIYLDASVDERANRRYNELSEKGIDCDIDTIKDQISQRDFADKTRDINPLIIAEDAIKIDTSEMTIEQVVEIIEALVNGLYYEEM